MSRPEREEFYRCMSEYIRSGGVHGLENLFQPGFDPAIAAIYRNGFYRSCREVLANTYCSVNHWLGDQHFATLARAYVERYPPRQGTLTGYGAELPAWLAAELEDKQSWLVDVARLDRAWIVCLHGEDVAPLTPQTVATLVEEGIDIAHCPIKPLANACLVETNSNVFDAWSAYKSGSHSYNMEPVAQQGGQKVLFWRPAMEVYARVLSEPEWIFLKTLERQQVLEASSAAVLENNSDFDLADLFAQLLSNGVLQSQKEQLWQ